MHALLILGLAIFGADKPAAAFEWPARAGWKTETIPFPLDFAPELPLHGVEELRFAPGFFDPASPGYFTYAFVWWLDDPALEMKSVASDLETYFFGLCRAVAKDEKLCAREKHAVALEGAPSAKMIDGHRAIVQRATIKTVDAFKTRAELILDVELSVWRCPSSARTVLLAKLSPHAKPSALVEDLKNQAAAFHCHRGAISP